MSSDKEKAVPEEVTLRAWSAGDAEALLRIANDREVWVNLRDRFPHPLTIPAAHLWLAERVEDAPRTSFAVDWKGALVGGISLRRREDVHHICADLGFWIGREYWRRGLATIAVRQATQFAFDRIGLERVQTFVFDWTTAPATVLQRCGFTLEGRLRRYVLRDGRFADALLYSKLKSDPP